MKSNEERGGAPDGGSPAAVPGAAESGLRRTVAVGTDTLARLNEVRRHLARSGVDVTSACSAAGYLLDRAEGRPASAAQPRRGERGTSLSLDAARWRALVSLADRLNDCAGASKRFSPSAALAWLVWGYDLERGAVQ